MDAGSFLSVISHTRRSFFLRGSLVLFAVFCTGGVLAEEPPFEPGEVSQDTAAALEKYHMTHRPLDDDLSAEWLAAFLDRLDPRHMYFQEIDDTEFRPFERRLDDLATDADFQFARLVQKRYR